MNVYAGPVAVVSGRAARRLVPVLAAALGEARRRGEQVDETVLEAVRDLEEVARVDRERQSARGLAMACRASASTSDVVPIVDRVAEVAACSERMSTTTAADLLDVSPRGCGCWDPPVLLAAPGVPVAGGRSMRRW